jgi:CheY-like chemotaxis protein
MSGMEYVEMAIGDCQDPACLPSQMSSNFDSIVSCLSSVRNTHAFMLMTINRCIDYTKASNGMKLVPKYDTMNLLEVIQLPLNCVMGIQNRIEICLKPVPSKICPYIISDKQWLQENMLCLLSNAVKYSVDCQVDITISLEEYYAEAFIGPNSICVDHDDNEISRSVFSSRGSSVSSKMDKAESDDFEEPDNIYPNMTPFIRIEVEDTGIGMSEESMSLLFNPFKQNQRLAGGTGLGLYSLAKRLEALNGFYGVMKRRDGKQGSLFWLAFPYKPDRMQAKHMRLKSHGNSLRPLMSSVVESVGKGLRANTTHNTTEASSFNEPGDSTLLTVQPGPSPVNSSPHENCGKLSPINEGLTILLVDDSPSIVKMSSMMLKRLGHVIVTAENGAVAVKIIQQRWDELQLNFDVVLMDLQMPVMDGLEATRRIRQIEKARDVTDLIVEREIIGGSKAISLRQKIVGMSANSDHETTLLALQAGVDAFMAKPFNMESLRTIFNQLAIGANV